MKVEEVGPSVLDRADNVLQAFGLSEELTLADIVRRAGLPRSSVHRILQHMVALQWIERRGHNYRLGLRMREFGNHVFQQDGLHRAALPVMYDLRDDVGFSVHLMVLGGADSVVLQTIWGPRTPPVIVPSRLPASRTAGGKVLLACLLPQVLADLAVAAEQEDLTDAGLARELEQVREIGMAISRNTAQVGNVTVAVPVGPIGSASAALAVSGPASVLRPQAVVGQLRNAASAAWRASAKVPPPNRSRVEMRANHARKRSR